MSLLPILWALKSAPVVDAQERAILVALAESAWTDGTDAFPSKKTIAEIAVVDWKTVQRRLRTLADRKLIAPGNQQAAAYIPEHFRPTVYDLLIPYSWYPDIEQVNAERKGRGKPPLTPEERPDLAAAPPKKRRADKGKPRPKKEAATDESGGGVYKTPGENTAQSGQEGGLQDPGVGSTSPPGGVYKSQRGGLEDPQPSPANPPHDPPRPSIPDDEAGDKEGGTDGSGAAKTNPGVELLLAIGGEKPEFLLTGKTLRDQGLTVAGMLVSGWTPEQLRQVIAGRPLPPPHQIKTSVGGLVAGRLRDAMAGPAPSSVPSLPAQAGGLDDKPTPTPDHWRVKKATVDSGVHAECVGEDGMCGRPVVAGSQFCLSCSEHPATAPF